MMSDRKTALITGGTRGIGLGIAEALAGEGYDLVLCGRREPDAVQPVIDELEAAGGEVLYVQADISDSTSRERLVEAAYDKSGRVDVLVNNAGMAPRERKNIADATEESYDEVMSVNLKGPYFLTQLVARKMLDAKEKDCSCRGCIIFITSVSADTASVSRGEYCISKAGLSMAAQLWSVHLAENGIPVYEIRPGITQTDMTAGVKDKYDKLIDEGLLLQPRWGVPADVGKAVAMLARGDLPYSTGQVINIDGGFGIKRL
jgi:NAD(P)-dependent dehydrogenase (short-subunit alcohol dehydrogenase family)